MTVLLVDDDPDLLLITKVILEKTAGFHVLKALTGTEALEIAHRERPDVVLLDVMMPDIDGPELVGEVSPGSEAEGHSRDLPYRKERSGSACRPRPPGRPGGHPEAVQAVGTGGAAYGHPESRGNLISIDGLFSGHWGRMEARWKPLILDLPIGVQSPLEVKKQVRIQESLYFLRFQKWAPTRLDRRD